MCIPRSFLKDIKDGGEDDLQDEVYENPPVGTLNDLVRKTVNIIVVEFNSQSGTVEFNIYNAEDATEAIDESDDQEVFLDEETDVGDFDICLSAVLRVRVNSDHKVLRHYINNVD